MPGLMELNPGAGHLSSVLTAADDGRLSSKGNAIVMA